MVLLIIVVLSLILVPLVIMTSGALRIALGLVFVLFFPGYTLIAALFPRKDALAYIERLFLSFGLSIVVVPLIGLALNYTPWGIRLQSVLLSLLMFIITMAGVAFYRRFRLPSEERFKMSAGVSLSWLTLNWRGQRPWDKLWTVLLVLALAGTIGTLVYAIQTPKVGESFTEFYILSPQSKTANYPRDLILGENGRVIVGIVNREHETTEYRVEITIDGENVDELESITLNHEETREWEVAFSTARAGPDQKVEFELYKGTNSDPYRTLHLWVNVNEGS